MRSGGRDSPGVLPDAQSRAPEYWSRLDADGLQRTLGEVHWRYTRHVNERERWRGYFWQGRFSSFVMDKAHFMAAVRYVELNPVCARLAKRSEDWLWSSAAAHLAGYGDGIFSGAPPFPPAGGRS